MWGGGGGGGWHGGGMGGGGFMARGGMARGRLGEYLDEDELGRPYNHKVVTRLLGYLRPHPRRVSVSIVALLVYTATQVASPWIVGFGINRVLQHMEFGVIFLPLALFAANYVVNFAANYVHLVALARVGQSVLYALRTEMFAHIQKLSASFMDRNEAGRVMSRVQNDVTQLQEFLSIIVLSLGDLLSLVGIIVVMFLMSAQLALVTLASVPVLFLVLAIWQRVAWRSFMRVRRAISVVNSGLQENISGVRVVQALGRERVNLRQFDGVNREHLQANLQAARFSAALMPVVEILTAVSIALVIILGGRMVIEGTLEVGFLVGFILYIQRFYDPIRNMTMQYTQLQRAMTSGVRIFELLDTRPEVQDKPNAVSLPPIRGDITFDGVHFGYDSGGEVLKGIDLQIDAGQTVALVGPSGAGKTTLVALIARFYDVTGGRILVDGHDLRDVKRSSLAGQMAMVLQEPFLFSASVRENIVFNHAGATDEQVTDAAKVAGAHDFIMRLPLGYETRLEERGQNLSLGQRQLISFARAVLADPRILVLDEATANIDTHTEQLIQQAMGRVLRGRTAVVIAHRLSTVRKADVIVVLDNGGIAEQGTHQELLARSGLYAHLYSTYFSQQQTVQTSAPG
ncbi:MAG: ABC transporter ATP-binding protein [SAR202 cluster bacterium]|nr:ABC transporter ATP-binding protein [SAR202 cluster bacterium]